MTGLKRPPDVLLMDATGLDHPRGAGLAVHLGAVTGVPSVGVTHRPLVAVGTLPATWRGATSPAELHGRTVGRWTCTKPGARPVLAHVGWRTDADTAGRSAGSGSSDHGPYSVAGALARSGIRWEWVRCIYCGG